MIQDTIIEKIRTRRDTIEKWLKAEAPYTRVDQCHLDANSSERAYWHHGYGMALDDILRFLEVNSNHIQNNTDNSQ